MPNETSKDPKTQAQPQTIPLSLIHDLPGVFEVLKPDKTYGGLVTSIRANGVKDPVILRQREDGQYQLVAGSRRRRASELAGKKDIPAFVYDMTLKEAQDYHKAVKTKPDTPIPGKLIETVKDEKAQGDTKAAPAGNKPKEAAADAKAPAEGQNPAEPSKDDKAQGEAKAAPAGDKPKEAATDAKAPAEGQKPAEPSKDEKAQGDAKAAPAGDKSKEAAADTKAPAEEKKAAEPSKDEKAQGEAKAAPAGDKSKEAAADTKAPTGEKKAAEPSKDEKAQGEAKAAPAGDKSKEAAADTKAPAGEKKAAEPAKPIAVSGPAAQGPAGTAISQVFEPRLNPPDEKTLKDLPAPKEGESFFIILHPAYLEKSKFNTISVNTQAEDYLELKQSIKLNGVKDPVLCRINPEGGGLEIASGQRRHMIATELNYPVPAIIQKMDDADVKILVNDGNLHRPQISTYDRVHALRGKMEGMKQKAGRRKKGEAGKQNTDEILAKEMGISVSMLNRMIRLSEAIKDVCDRVDDGSLTISIASAISFLKPKTQEEVLRLSDVGYKLTNERIERMKKVEAKGKLSEQAMRDILDDKDIAPKQAPVQTPTAPPAGSPPPAPPAPPTGPSTSIGGTTPAQGSTPTTGQTPQATESGPAMGTPSSMIPASPDVQPGQVPSTGAAASAAEPGQGKEEPFKGPQERPEVTKVILTGDRLRKYFPDVNMTPREIEESVYEALEERRQRQIKDKTKASAILHPAHKR